MKRCIVKKELVLKRLYSETTLPVGTPVNIEVIEVHGGKNIRLEYNLNSVIVTNFMGGNDKQNDYFLSMRTENANLIKDHFRYMTEVEKDCEKYNI